MQFINIDHYISLYMPPANSNSVSTIAEVPITQRTKNPEDFSSRF